MECARGWQRGGSREIPGRQVMKGPGGYILLLFSKYFSSRDVSGPKLRAKDTKRICRRPLCVDLGVISAAIQVRGSEALRWGWGIWRQLSAKDVQVKPWPGVGITWGAFNTRPSPPPPRRKPWPHP